MVDVFFFITGKKLLEIKSQWGFTPLDLAATEEMREILKSDSHREPPAKRQKIDSQASSSMLIYVSIKVEPQ